MLQNNESVCSWTLVKLRITNKNNRARKLISCAIIFNGKDEKDFAGFMFKKCTKELDLY